jgi:hypothetical protein
VVIGCTLAFHLAFTFLLVTKSQPDLHYGGTFFSLTVIYLINLLIITGFLLGLCPHSVDPEHSKSYTGYLQQSAELIIRICAYLWFSGSEGIDALRAALGK